MNLSKIHIFSFPWNEKIPMHYNVIYVRLYKLTRCNHVENTWTWATYMFRCIGTQPQMFVYVFSIKVYANFEGIQRSQDCSYTFCCCQVTLTWKECHIIIAVLQSVVFICYKDSNTVFIFASYLLLKVKNRLVASTVWYKVTFTVSI